MDYKFPVINHINDVLPYIKDRKEFIVAERDGFTIVNYNVVMPDTFSDDQEGWEIRRECRGITFYEDGSIAARKFQKFFNVGERDETQFNMININKPHVILEKLDGSMITPFQPGLIDRLDADASKLEWHTKMGATDVAQPVNDFVSKNQQYARYSAHVMAGNYTPIFEWCSRKNRIVIDYPEDRLVLVAMRHNETGEYLQYDEMVKAKTHGIDVVEAYDATFDADFLDYVRELIGIEGFVIRFDDGHMVKIKSEDYLKFHRARDAIAQEKNVWALILDAEVDDLKSFLLPEDRKRIEAFEKVLWNAVNDLVKAMEDRMTYAKNQLNKRDYSMFEDAGRERKKMFALEFTQLSCDQLKPVMFRLYEGGHTREVILDWIRNNLSTGTKLEKIRWLFNVRFNPGFVEE